MSEPVPEPETRRGRQRARNRALGLFLGGLALLFFAITIARLGLRAAGAG